MYVLCSTMNSCMAVHASNKETIRYLNISVSVLSRWRSRKKNVRGRKMIEEGKGRKEKQGKICILFMWLWFVCRWNYGDARTPESALYRSVILSNLWASVILNTIVEWMRYYLKVSAIYMEIKQVFLNYMHISNIRI